MVTSFAVRGRLPCQAAMVAMVAMHNSIRNKDVDIAIKRLEGIQNQQEES